VTFRPSGHDHDSAGPVVTTGVTAFERRSRTAELDPAHTARAGGRLAASLLVAPHAHGGLGLGLNECLVRAALLDGLAASELHPCARSGGGGARNSCGSCRTPRVHPRAMRRGESSRPASADVEAA